MVLGTQGPETQGSMKTPTWWMPPNEMTSSSLAETPTWRMQGKKRSHTNETSDHNRAR